jgi:hypothetical protein
MRWFAWSRPQLSEIMRRWPALETCAVPAVLRALDEMRRVQDANVPENDLVRAEPALKRLVVAGPAEVRRAALDTWATVLEGRVRREHMDLLADLSSEADLDSDLLEGVIRAALTFDDGGRLATAIAENARPHSASRAV